MSQQLTAAILIFPYSPFSYEKRAESFRPRALFYLSGKIFINWLVTNLVFPAILMAMMTITTRSFPGINRIERKTL